jgi:hypothetical protein
MAATKGKYRTARQTGVFLAERRAYAFSLMVKGKPIDDIVRAVKIKFSIQLYTDQMAFADIQEAANHRLTNGSQDKRTQIAVQACRLDLLYNAIHLKAMEGSIHAVQTALKILVAKADLLGLAAGVQEQVDERLRVEIIQMLQLFQSKLDPITYQEVVNVLESSALPSSIDGEVAETGGGDEDGDGDGSPPIEVSSNALPLGMDLDGEED